MVVAGGVAHCKAFGWWGLMERVVVENDKYLKAWPKTRVGERMMIHRAPARCLFGSCPTQHQYPLSPLF